jgi:molecular chaperone GrpE
VTKHRPTHHEPEHAGDTKPPPTVAPAGPQTETAVDAKPRPAVAPAGPQTETAVDAKPRPAVAPEGPQPEVAPAVEDPAALLRAELEAAKDRALRCHAELDNYRKRAARELEEKLRYANLPLLRDLLPVLDNVERAIQAAQQNTDAGALLDGFKMVQQQVEEVLKRHHCRQIEALHSPFDPHVHHAVMQQPSDEHPANTVLMVTQTGYQLHDRVVRPSQVIVSTTAK